MEMNIGSQMDSLFSSEVVKENTIKWGFESRNDLFIRDGASGTDKRMEYPDWGAEYVTCHSLKSANFAYLKCMQLSAPLGLNCSIEIVAE